MNIDFRHGVLYAMARLGGLPLAEAFDGSLRLPIRGRRSDARLT